MRGIALEVEVFSLKKDVEQFWSDIWGNKGNFNQNVEFLKLLETSYCPNVIEKDCLLYVWNDFKSIWINFIQSLTFLLKCSYISNLGLFNKRN